MNISKEDEMWPLKPIAQAFHDAIPASIPVIPAIGNHDTSVFLSPTPSSSHTRPPNVHPFLLQLVDQHVRLADRRVQVGRRRDC